MREKKAAKRAQMEAISEQIKRDQEEKEADLRYKKLLAGEAGEPGVGGNLTSTLGNRSSRGGGVSAASHGTRVVGSDGNVKYVKSSQIAATSRRYPISLRENDTYCLSRIGGIHSLRSDSAPPSMSSDSLREDPGPLLSMAQYVKAGMAELDRFPFGLPPYGSHTCVSRVCTASR